ncbi:dephospho-CoA kinase [Phreatobacter oligotrophus]|jgi:dephospho-CoA kinase|uniref:dephospho-CoA kinase n=1 Tax=Phreatobacter oligotrophus TaxID=1122261 RepID=UPI00235790D5|nr:dephospho-CoA kinase [Phreatobacter oligotrophus]MBX9992566.1 dephospho-CoA kinase [Phreatobacter oligotrophus]
MFVLGLTGSIGMGKSTTSAFFREAGIPVHDADAAVHRLYAGDAVAPIEAAFPGVTVDGRVDRARLGAVVLKDAEALKRLEAIIHPLVGGAEKAFRDAARARGHTMVVLDIPLLLETGGERRVDAVAVVSAPAAIQRDRVMARPGMTADKLEAILARQMPDAEKRRRAHFVIESGFGLDAARRQVSDLIRALAGSRRSH